MSRSAMFLAAFLMCGFAAPLSAVRGESDLNIRGEVAAEYDLNMTATNPAVTGAIDISLNLVLGSPTWAFSGLNNLLNAQQKAAMDAWWELDPDGWITKAYGIKALEMILWSLSISYLIPKDTMCDPLSVSSVSTASEDLYGLARMAYNKVHAYEELFKQKGRASTYPEVDQDTENLIVGVYQTLECVKKYLTQHLYNTDETGAFAGTTPVEKDPLIEVALFATGVVEGYQGRNRLPSFAQELVAATGSDAIPKAGLCEKNAAWALGEWTLNCNGPCTVAIAEDRFGKIERDEGDTWAGPYLVTEFDKNWYASMGKNYWYMKAISRGAESLWRVKCSADNRAMLITIAEKEEQWYAWSGFAGTYYADFRVPEGNYAMRAYITKE